VRRAGTRAALRTGRGRSGKKTKRSFSSFPCTSRTSCALRGFGTAPMPRSRGATAAGSAGRGCASGSPFGVGAMPRGRGPRETPRSAGTVPILERGCFFVIALGEIAYTLASARRDDGDALEGGLWHGPRRRAKAPARAAQVANRLRRVRPRAPLAGALARHARPRARAERGKAQRVGAQRVRAPRAKAQPSGVRIRARAARSGAPADASRRRRAAAARRRGVRPQRHQQHTLARITKARS